MSPLAAWLGRWRCAPSEDPSPPASSSPEVSCAAARNDPPGDPHGLPALAVAEVIAPHRDCLRRLRDAYGAEQDTFDRDVRGVIERYAQYVHLLPAAADGPFGHAGGLFRMGLDIGFYALQASDGALFPGHRTISARAALEPRWRYATFLAGLCCELHRCLSHLSVCNDQGAVWPAYRQPLALWLRDTDSRRYRVQWQTDPLCVRALGLLAMAHVVAPTDLQHLAQGNQLVVPHLAAALSAAGLPGEANTLDRLVRRSAALVCERTLQPGTDSALRRPPCAAAAAAPRQAPALSLIAPARLHPAVREALRQIVADLAAQAPSPAGVMDSGVFVPLHELARRRVDPVLAVRALSEAGMLACDPAHPQSRTCLRHVDHKPVLGVVLAPGCIAGLDTRSGSADPS
jgi:hypothetical protein